MIANADLHSITWGSNLPNNWLTDTRIFLEIENAYDWMVFCDIWVNREYDVKINTVDNSRKVIVLDLGANVGYFSLFMAHQLRRMGQTNYRIDAIEACEPTYEILRKRTAQDNNIFPFNYAVGNKKGFTKIAHSGNHATSMLVHLGDPNWPNQLIIDYLNLDRLGHESIDLIKCDIEGSEFDLVENFPDVFKKTQMVMMEIHHTVGDANKLRETLKSYGFNGNRVLRDGAETTTEVFFK